MAQEGYAWCAFRAQTQTSASYHILPHGGLVDTVWVAMQYIFPYFATRNQQISTKETRIRVCMLQRFGYSKPTRPSLNCSSFANIPLACCALQSVIFWAHGFHMFSGHGHDSPRFTAYSFSERDGFWIPSSAEVAWGDFGWPRDAWRCSWLCTGAEKIIVAAVQRVKATASVRLCNPSCHGYGMLWIAMVQ